MYFKLFFFVFTLQLFAQERSIRRVQTASDEYDKYTSVGNLGLTITNFGILGNGWNRMEDGSIHPSCQYKQQTEIPREQIEHFSYSGLWVGGIVNGERRVSTSIVDGVFESGSEGFELFANNSNPSLPDSKTPSTIEVETLLSPFTIPPTQSPEYEKCSICSRGISVCCLYWHDGCILPSSIRFHPLPSMPKLVIVRPRLPTEVYLSYSSEAV